LISLLKSAKKFPTKGAIALVKVYKAAFSPFLPSSCRFFPSCSTYSIEAFKSYGFFKGLFLSIWRILRCNPFNEGGYDPVPAPASLKRALSGEDKEENVALEFPPKRATNSKL
jgi:putative membrane protein insertion efficiency factor